MTLSNILHILALVQGFESLKCELNRVHSSLASMLFADFIEVQKSAEQFSLQILHFEIDLFQFFKMDYSLVFMV